MICFVFFDFVELYAKANNGRKRKGCLKSLDHDTDTNIAQRYIQIQDLTYYDYKCVE